MNIRIGRQQSKQGSTLAVTFMTCVILGLLMGSYLYMVQGQRQSVARSQCWNQALVVAEAGVDEAMALLNSGMNIATFAPDGRWVPTSSNITAKIYPAAAKQFGDSYYSVTIYKTNLPNPVIVATGFVPAPLSTQLISRVVEVVARPRSTFPVKAPMIVKQSFDSNGNNVATDSFDSSVGPYNPLTAGTNGDVVSLLTNALSITVGNGKINGTVRTPPGGTYGTTSDKTATIGSNGKVGDAAWLLGSTPGFQPGHFKDDFILSDFPDVTAPNATWFAPQANVSVGGKTYDYFLGTFNTYSVGNLSGSLYVSQPNTVLYVTGTVSISGNAQGNRAAPQIRIGPDASLTMYVAGASTSITGNGVVNETSLAKNFQYYGLPNNTSISITGNGAFYGTIYAPQADFTLKGSGNNSTDDFTGSSITKNTTMTGNFNFHYDDSLSTLTTLGGYDVISWEEL
jgi:hypothetical protein